MAKRATGRPTKAPSRRRMDWAAYVRNNRKMRRMTRRKLAELVDIDPSYITLIERDGYRPAQDKVEGIARALSLPLEDCLLAAGYSNELVAKVYRERSATSILTRTLVPSLGQQIKKLAYLNEARQKSVATALKGMLEVANG